MLFWSRTLIFTLALGIAACTPTRPATPRETFITYTKAIAKKDTAAMKVLLSNDSIRMHEKEAQAQGVPLDEIIRRETLFTEGQKVVEFRNEKIEGDKASLEVKNADRKWETVPFVREDGEWKIDKQGYADLMLKEIERNSGKASSS